MDINRFEQMGREDLKKEKANSPVNQQPKLKSSSFSCEEEFSFSAAVKLCIVSSLSLSPAISANYVLLAVISLSVFLPVHRVSPVSNRPIIGASNQCTHRGTTEGKTGNCPIADSVFYVLHFPC